MKKVIFKSLFAIGLVSLVLNGCRKKDVDETDRDTTAASDNALAEGTYTDVNNIADEAANKGGGTGSILGNCATITFSVSPDTTMTIDFGSVNCLCSDGRYRRGQILVNWSGAYKDPGHVHTITFNNYFVNDNQVMGTKTVTNSGFNNAGNLYFTIDVNGSIILSAANGGGTITWTSQRTREFIEGASTPQISDDVYLISGTASGSSSSGRSFTASTITPVRKEMSCSWLVSGTIEFNPSGKPTRTIDFGNGNCDNKATVTINGNSFQITLR
jgi:hypothetical protein